MATVRYVFMPDDEAGVGQTGLTPGWRDDLDANDMFYRTSDMTALTAPTISEQGTSGIYYFDVDYDDLAAAHITGTIDWGAAIGTLRRYQRWRGAATDYSGWCEGYEVTVQIYETGTTTPITDHAVLTLYDSTGTYARSPALGVNDDGQVVFNAPNGTYRVAPKSTPYVTWQSTPWTVTVNGAVLSTTKYGTVWEPSAPTSPDGCVLFLLAGDIAGVAIDEGTFEVTGVVSPSTISSGATTQRVVLTDNPVTITDGRAEIEVLQGAVVDTRFVPEDGIPIEKRVTIPAADSANWDTL